MTDRVASTTSDSNRLAAAQVVDAIVIGSGLGGLTAGALYAKAGHRVLVLERNQSFGGAATVYQHGALAIEVSLHEIDGLDAGDPKAAILHSLGLDCDIPFVDVGDLHEVRTSLLGAPFVLPHGLDAALSATTRRFPRHAAGLDRYFKRMCDVRRAVAMLSQHQDDPGWWLRNAATIPRLVWPLIRDRHATLGGVLRHHFGNDEAVKLSLASNLPYYSDDPETMPFVAYAIPQASYLLGGGHYVRGGSRVLTDQLIEIVRGASGEVLAGREACTIMLDGDRVRGVQHTDRRGGNLQEHQAPVVFGNAAPNVLAAMLPERVRASFAARYRRQRHSISLWTISLGLSRHSSEFGVQHYSTAILPDWLTTLGQMREAGKFMSGDPGLNLPPYGVVAYDQIDSGLNISGPYLVSMVGVDRLENWTDIDAETRRLRKQRWMDRVVGDLNVRFPGIEGAIVHREMSTAETFHQFLNTPGGAVYGFAPETRGFMPMPKTTIRGLFLASAFTGGGGFTGAILGGGWAARAAMARPIRT
jgi:phytoene dehydrogenase-like protein